MVNQTNGEWQNLNVYHNKLPYENFDLSDFLLDKYFVGT